MQDLNNPDSEIYIKTLKDQKLYIKDRLNKIRNIMIGDPTGCCGRKEDIAKHLNMGHAQNLIKTFFKYKTTTCMLCNCKKGENNVKQLERAHCNIYSRYDLLMMAINDLYIDDKTPIKSGDILKLFIQKHETCPIYMLCNICHNNYDSNFTTIY